MALAEIGQCSSIHIESYYFFPPCLYLNVYIYIHIQTQLYLSLSIYIHWISLACSIEVTLLKIHPKFGIRSLSPRLPALPLERFRRIQHDEFERGDEFEAHTQCRGRKGWKLMAKDTQNYGARGRFFFQWLSSTTRNPPTLLSGLLAAWFAQNHVKIFQ